MEYIQETVVSSKTGKLKYYKRIAFRLDILGTKYGTHFDKRERIMKI